MDMDQSQSQYRVRRRQEPISCQFCRTRKLKCDRQSPCSNCSARGVVCQRARPAERPHREVKQTLPDTPGILSRLEELENAVFGSNDRHPQTISTQLPSSPEIIQDDGANAVNEEHRTASKWLEGVATREDSTVRYLSASRTLLTITSFRLAQAAYLLHSNPYPSCWQIQATYKVTGYS